MLSRHTWEKGCLIMMVRIYVYANRCFPGWERLFVLEYLLCAVGWMHILNTHGGKLPLLIKAVPEGTVVPTRNGNIFVKV